MSGLELVDGLHRSLSWTRHTAAMVEAYGMVMTAAGTAQEVVPQEDGTTSP